MPSLPLDLERLIFELAALQDTDHGVQIMLVAKRVYEWIRPILYRVVAIIDRSASVQKPFGTLIIHRWPDARVFNSAQFVRHLLLRCPSQGLNSHALLEMASSFPNIENLAIWRCSDVTPHVLEKINHLPLRMLSVEMVALEGCAAHQNLTHLELFGFIKLTRRACKVLIELPKLTHLSLATTIHRHLEDAALPDLLKHCASLQVLVVLEDRRAERWTTLDDPQFLVLVVGIGIQEVIEGWARSANGLTGCWELAERITEARKRSLFKDNGSFVFCERTWMEGLDEDGMRWYEEWLGGPHKDWSSGLNTIAW